MDIRDTKNFTVLQKNRLFRQQWKRVVRYFLFAVTQIHTAGNNLLPHPVTNTLKLTNQYWESVNLTEEQGSSHRGSQHLMTCRQRPWLGATGAQDAIENLSLKTQAAALVRLI